MNKQQQQIMILAIAGIAIYFVYKNRTKRKNNAAKTGDEIVDTKQYTLVQAAYWNNIGRILATSGGSIPEEWNLQEDIQSLHDELYSGLFSWIKNEEKIYNLFRNRNAWQVKLMLDGFYSKYTKQAEMEIERLFNEGELAILNDILNKVQ